MKLMCSTKWGSATLNMYISDNSQSATLERVENGVVTSVNTLSVGDMAEYDSYNLSYYGPIVKFGKRVSVSTGRSGAVKRLKPEVFLWRNYNFNLEKVRKENSDTMMYI